MKVKLQELEKNEREKYGDFMFEKLYGKNKSGP